MKIFAGSSCPDLGKKIADYLGIPLGKVDLKKFNNGETYARFDENIRDRDVFLIQSLHGKR